MNMGGFFIFIPLVPIPIFQQHDLVTDKIPEQFDLILSRHTMIHLYNADVLQVLKNFQDSGSRSDSKYSFN